jgi:hypothetical protein
LVEQRTENPRVGGSIPSLAIIKKPINIELKRRFYRSLRFLFLRLGIRQIRLSMPKHSQQIASSLAKQKIFRKKESL